MNVALVLVISAWIAIGVVLSVLMGRRGHNAFGWLIIGVFLGPLSIPLAVASARHEEPGRFVQVSPGSAPIGHIDVLVGYDGSAEAKAAASASVSGRR